jgi:hypothetical protein
MTPSPVMRFSVDSPSPLKVVDVHTLACAGLARFKCDHFGASTSVSQQLGTSIHFVRLNLKLKRGLCVVFYTWCEIN